MSNFNKDHHLTFASLGAIHVGKQDVVVICPVEPLVGVIDSESSRVIDLCVNDNSLPSAVHANTANVRRFTAVHPEHVPDQRNSRSKRWKNYTNIKWWWTEASTTQQWPCWPINTTRWINVTFVSFSSNLKRGNWYFLRKTAVWDRNDKMLTLFGDPELDLWGSWGSNW